MEVLLGFFFSFSPSLPSGEGQQQRRMILVKKDTKSKLGTSERDMAHVKISKQSYKLSIGSRFNFISAINDENSICFITVLILISVLRRRDVPGWASRSTLGFEFSTMFFILSSLSHSFHIHLSFPSPSLILRKRKVKPWSKIKGSFHTLCWCFGKLSCFEADPRVGKRIYCHVNKQGEAGEKWIFKSHFAITIKD